MNNDIKEPAALADNYIVTELGEEYIDALPTHPIGVMLRSFKEETTDVKTEVGLIISTAARWVGRVPSCLFSIIDDYVEFIRMLEDCGLLRPAAVVTSRLQAC